MFIVCVCVIKREGDCHWTFEGVVCVCSCVFSSALADVVPPVWVVSLNAKTVLTPFSFVFTRLHEAKSVWSASGAFYWGCQKCSFTLEICVLRLKHCARVCVWAVIVWSVEMMWLVSMLWFSLLYFFVVLAQGSTAQIIIVFLVTVNRSTLASAKIKDLKIWQIPGKCECGFCSTQTLKANVTAD